MICIHHERMIESCLNFSNNSTIHNFSRDNIDHDNISAVYHDLVGAYHSSDSSEVDEVDVENDIDKPSTSTQRPRRTTTRRPARSVSLSSDWRVACRKILQELWECEDSVPFRYTCKIFPILV